MFIGTKIVEAQEAAQEWLALVDNSEYTVSWSTAAPYFKNALVIAFFPLIDDTP